MLVYQGLELDIIVLSPGIVDLVYAFEEHAHSVDGLNATIKQLLIPEHGYHGILLRHGMPD